MLPQTLLIPKEMLSFDKFDHIDLCVSAGNDSSAMVLMMLHAYKAPKEKMRLIHFRIDGPKDDDHPVFFDWEQTEAHLDYLSHFFDIPLVTLWDEKGLKERIEDREMFPDAMNRFCTSYGKRDVYSKYVRRSDSSSSLCCSGELACESSRRRQYPSFEIHKANADKRKNRVVQWFRPILHLSKIDVKALMKKYGVKEHECYQYVSRCSCKFCIFNTKSEMKVVAEMYPDDFKELKAMERRMGHTMRFKDNRAVPLCEFIEENSPYQQLKLI